MTETIPTVETIAAQLWEYVLDRYSTERMLGAIYLVEDLFGKNMREAVEARLLEIEAEAQAKSLA